MLRSMCHSAGSRLRADEQQEVLMVLYLGDRQALVVDALDGCRLEGGVPYVGPQQQRGAAGGDDALFHHACHHSAHPRHPEGLIDDELCSLIGLVVPALTMQGM